MSKCVNLAVVIEGGVVSAIVADDPTALADVRITVIDYDTEGSDTADNWRIFDVKQADGSNSRAWASAWEIDQATIGLDRLVSDMDARP